MAANSKGIKDYKILKPNKVINDLVAHIEAELPLFVESHTFQKIMIKKKNETQHSTAFNVFMMKNQDKFTFMNEVAQVGSFTIDIGIYEKSTDELIFTIEAKVLPTPPGTRKNPRSESEYVYAEPGHRGAGIERFKSGNHGVDNNLQPLPINGMLAYIKEKDFDEWFIAINGWINKIEWGSAEQLQKSFINATAKFESAHIRVDNSTVVLHHFWLKVE